MKGSSSSRKLTMKLVARIFRQKGSQVNSYTLYLWNNTRKGCLCILMSYITWPTLAYLIICFYLLLMMILSRHVYDYMHTHLCLYKYVCSVPTFPHCSFCMQGWLGVRIIFLIFLTSVLFRVTKFKYMGSVQKANSKSIHK